MTRCPVKSKKHNHLLKVDARPMQTAAMERAFEHLFIKHAAIHRVREMEKIKEHCQVEIKKITTDQAPQTTATTKK